MITQGHIIHVTTPESWRRQADTPFYEADSLSSEGFIHNCHPPQLRGVLGRHFAGNLGLVGALVLLVIDPALLTSELREEEASAGERFPHIYGPLDRAAVLSVLPIETDGLGSFTLPEGFE